MFMLNTTKSLKTEKKHPTMFTLNTTKSLSLSKTMRGLIHAMESVAPTQRYRS